MSRQSNALAPLASLLLLLPGALGGLLILDGPASIVGRDFVLARYFFAPTFDVTSAVIITDNADWDYGSCPPRYTGSVDVAGAVVVHTNPNRVCTFQSHAKGAAAARAALWVNFNSDTASADGRAGRTRNYWRIGEDGARGPPAADASEAAAYPLLDALREGARVRARATPSMSEWERMHTSPFYYLFQAVCALGAFACLELAACRLYAFVRSRSTADASAQPVACRLTIPTSMLATEVLLNVTRAIYFLLDPDWAYARQDFGTGVLLMGMVVALGTCTTAMFLVYYAQAAGTAGVASARLHLRGPRAALLCFVTLALAVELAGSAIFFVVDNQLVFLFKTVSTFLAVPLVLVTLAVVVLCQSSLRLRHLPEAVLGRLLQRLRLSTALCTIALLGGATTMVSTWHPWRSLACNWVLHTASIASSYAQIDAFTPVASGAAKGVPRGPLRVAAEALATLAVRTWAACCCCCASKTGGGTRVWPGALRDPMRAPESQPLPSHLRLGVTVTFLHEFCARFVPSEATASYEVALKVHALAGASGRSLAEQCRDTVTADGHAAAGPAVVFVSHAHACSFRRMVDAVDHYMSVHNLNPATTYLWVDSFCMRLATQAREVLWIGRVERSLGHVVMVLDPWDKPVCLTRAWCLYEAVYAQQPGATFRLTVARNERERLLRALDDDRSAVERVLTAFDVRTAGLLLENDRDTLLLSIELQFGRERGENAGAAPAPARLRRLLPPWRASHGAPASAAPSADTPSAVSAAGGAAGSADTPAGAHEVKPEAPSSQPPASASVAPAAASATLRVASQAPVSEASTGQEMHHSGLARTSRDIAVQEFNMRTRDAILGALASMSWQI